LRFAGKKDFREEMFSLGKREMPGKISKGLPPEETGEKTYRKEKSIFDELELEFSKPETGNAGKTIEEIASELPTEKLKSPELLSEEENEEKNEDDVSAERRRMIILRIREIMASSARDRSEQLRALMSTAPRGLESMMQDIIRKYTTVLNEPGPEPEAVKRIETSTGPIFEPYAGRSDKRDVYSSGPEAPGGPSPYGPPSQEEEARRFRPGIDTGADTAVRKMMGKYRQDESSPKESYSERA
jgi:hypothetical protein